MKTLIHTNRIIVTTLLLVTAMFMPAMVWAQEQLPLTFVSADEWLSFENQGPENLVNGSAGTSLKWCSDQQGSLGEFYPFYIIVEADKRSVLKNYVLFEAHDIQVYENANWKDWTVYATNDTPNTPWWMWTEIHNVKGANLFNGQWGTTHTFNIDNNNTAYKYYMIRVTAIVGKTKYNSSEERYIQMMGHLQLFGEEADLCKDGNHIFVDTNYANDYSCTEDGNIAYQQCVDCKKCFDLDGNELEDGAWILPAAHRFSEFVDAKEPTCTEDGVSIGYHQCTVCKKYLDIDGNELEKGVWVIPKTGHSLNEDQICTKCGYEVPGSLSFTIKESLGGYDKEGPDKTINGNTLDKWCGDFNEGNPFIEFKADGSVRLDHYYLFTGNDIQSGRRNLKEWKLYAKKNGKDDWTEISHVTDAQLPNYNSSYSKNFYIPEEYKNSYYTLFKFEIISVVEGNVFEVGELCFMGTKCHHNYIDDSVICSICGDIKEHEHTYEDGICTLCGDWQNTLLSFNIVRAVSSIKEDETADKAFDGITTNKWCGKVSNGHPYVLLRHDCKARMKRYNLYTGDDIFSGDGNRNPKEWKLYAKENAGDSWTMISHVIEAHLTSSRSTLSQDYFVDAEYQDKYYKFFKFEIVDVEAIQGDGSAVFEIGELRFFGAPCSHSFDANDVCTACGAEKVHSHNYVNGICTKCEDYAPVNGEGTKASPYLIGNAGQLAWFRDQTRNARSNIHAKLTADIDMSAVCSETFGGWMAIDKYSATFDGDGHVLKNLYINDSYDRAGFFSTNDGVIMNLGIESGSVTSGRAVVGAICAHNNYAGKIINCFNNVNVESTYNHKKDATYVGGICGENEGTINRCYNNGDVFGRRNIGGICGYFYKGSITNCYNAGKVTGNTAGGICGSMNDTDRYVYLKNCYNIGEVTVFEKVEGGVKAISGGLGYYIYLSSYTNNFYLEGLLADEKGKEMTAAQFASGEVAWLLNGSNVDGKWTSGRTDGNQAWYQKLGTDAYPVLNKAEGCTVYTDCLNSTKSYSNEGGVTHVFGETFPAIEPTCLDEGNIAYHQCHNCENYFDLEGNVLEEYGWFVDALGHTKGQPEITVQPTCTKSGKGIVKCIRCDKMMGNVKLPALIHPFNDDLMCTVCGYQIGDDCIIEYTATEKLRYITEEGVVYDYTEKMPTYEEYEYRNWAEYLFGTPALMHEYDEATHKGRIICNSPVWYFWGYTRLRPETLTSITLPATVEAINSDVFSYCSNLTSITLHAEDFDYWEYRMYFGGCNSLQEIIVPYNSYYKYVEACNEYGYDTWYKDENGERHYRDTKDLLKSIVSLDDTKAFETQTIEVKADATLQRSFSDDGWYSLCLPFSVSVADSPFSQVAAYRRLDGDTYKFATVDNIEAGKAYIVKVDAAVANPTFKNVFITTEAPATDGDFIGVYSPTELGAGCKVIGSGTTVNPANPGTMKGFRAYFPASAAGAKAMCFSVDDGETTALRHDDASLQYDNDTLRYDNDNSKAYNLNGQRVSANHKGIVIKNGKKTLSPALSR